VWWVIAVIPKVTFRVNAGALFTVTAATQNYGRTEGGE